MAATRENLEEADLLLSVPGDTVLFKIEAESKEPLAQGLLQVLSVVDDEANEGFVFLACDKYHYPITMGAHVPTLRIAPRSYVLPLPDSAYLGLVLDEEEASDAEVAEFELFLAENTDFRAQQTDPAPPPVEPEESKDVVVSEEAPVIVPVEEAELVEQLNVNSGGGENVPQGGVVASTLGMVAGGIEGGSRIVGSGLIAGASLLGRGVRRGGSLFTSRVAPKAKPVAVSDGVKTKVRNVNHVSKAAVGVSSALVTGVRAMATSIGVSVAEAVNETKVGAKFGSGEGSSPALKAAKDVVVNTVVAVDTLHTSMAQAGKILLTDVGSTTVEVVGHRYGEDMGDVTGESLQAVGNVLEAGSNVRKIGVKSVARVAAKSTAKGVLVGAPPGDAASSSSDAALPPNTTSTSTSTSTPTSTATPSSS